MSAGRIARGSMTSLFDGLINAGARLVRQGRCVIFRAAEAVLSRRAAAGIFALITGPRGAPLTAVPAMRRYRARVRGEGGAEVFFVTTPSTV
jgi:hypothetical protein